ncbi:alcohol dehydrogenase [bacterium BMS3Abin02]|nr:alcohol dehydrogenase [bacterium BMS3Abin02]GBE21203.1 alcohol dehydrogenase [bacterium BMS3Bbin01]HDH26289.1 zinc-binding alcohol dehydrogenase family protein [Actinomycetota bacterium]HDL49404.1 zinc-binding alcohol dehydrogenase family protein [Actinomycetota bacterium]
MRAQVLHSPDTITEAPLVLEEVADPVPRAGELLLDVSACGVCRTDLQEVEGDLDQHRNPVIPGHQIVGEVEAIGAGVTGWQIGDRVGVGWLGGSCGRCRFCRTGRENLCEEAVFTGWDRDGGYAEKVTVSSEYAFRLPAEAGDLDVAPLLCGGVIGYRALKVSGIHAGGRLGLYGFGASALLALQVARHWDCEVYVATRSEEERKRALEMGAVWTGGYEDRPPVPLDAAITFAPVGRVVVEALKSLDRGGVVAINAIHLDRIPEFRYEDLWLERQIRSVANFTKGDADEFLRLAAEIPIRTVTQEYALADANRALLDLKQGSVHGAAVLRA